MFLRRSNTGYILVETIVAMGVLSISMAVIQGAIRQAIVTRGQAQDYTTARFLLETKMAELELYPLITVSSSKGNFPAPNTRFSYEWSVSKYEVPRPAFPMTMPEEERKKLEGRFRGKMVKLSVKVKWRRSGLEYESLGETLLLPERLWEPPQVKKR